MAVLVCGGAGYIGSHTVIELLENNVSSTINLLDGMKRHNVKHIVFSSTAATYGEPKVVQ